MWSVGRSLFEMVTGTYMFEDRLNPKLFNNDPLISSQMQSVYMFGKEEMSKRFRITDELNGHIDTFLPAFREHGRLAVYLKDKILNGPDVSLTYKKRHEMLDLLLKIFQLDPENRITASEALQHPFFTSTDV
jgi:serine/threonine protein kinase